MSNISRRKFLKTGAAALAGITIAPSTILGMSHGHISPTDKLNLAAVGIGGPIPRRMTSFLGCVILKVLIFLAMSENK